MFLKQSGMFLIRLTEHEIGTCMDIVADPGFTILEETKG